jgi:hypothetical protein
MDAMNLIAAALAAPKTHRVVTVYASGDRKVHETRSLATANNHATGERRKIGRDLIARDPVTLVALPGFVRVVDVLVEAI